MFSKIALSIEVLQRPSFNLLCGLPVGGQCPSSTAILNDWFWKIVSVWKLIVLGLGVKCFMLLKFTSSQILAFSDMKLRSLVRDSLIYSEVYENIFFNFFLTKITKLLQKKYVVIYL